MRSASASSLRAASRAGPWLARLALCADKLQAGGEARNVAAAEIYHGPAEMSQHEAGAGAITIAMPAITAKAANRLPLTPHPAAETQP